MGATLLKIEYEFTLPKGYVDPDGSLHRDGVMRLATAADELLPARDPRVQQNPAYLSIILLSRVVVRLGALQMITPKVVEELFASDFAFLEDLYQTINAPEPHRIGAVCPKCAQAFEIERPPPVGES